MTIRNARQLAMVAALALAVSGAAPSHVANAAPLGQIGGQPPESVGAPPPAPGQTLNPFDCSAVIAEEPRGRSPAIAEGDLGATEGPGTAGSGGSVNLEANPDCPVSVPLPPT
jgi:hypothetical protein